MRFIFSEMLVGTQGEGAITATLVADPARSLQYLPCHAGEYGIVLEDAIFSAMRSVAPDYEGGAWHSFTLSNGGYYMAPDAFARYRLSYEGLFDYEVSADTAGIIATATAYRRLSALPESATFGAAYKLLAAFIYQHKDVGIIRAALH
jgi:hypothetical protein